MAKSIFVDEIQGTSSVTNNTLVHIETEHNLIVDKIKTLTFLPNNLTCKKNSLDLFYINSTNKEFKFNDSYKLSVSNTLNFTSSGSILQRKMRMISTDFDYSTLGGYNEYFAQAECFRTKITTKGNNSGINVRIGINGESTAHNMITYPVRSFIDTSVINTTDWNHDIARHIDDNEAATQQYQYYCFGYTNIGNYSDADYSSTSIQTATMEFMDMPNVPAGTDIWYSIIFMSDSAQTFYVNRTVTSATTGAYERGVSYVYIEELNGENLTTTSFENGGILEYTY